jgi:Fe-S cluster assembly protein SufD
MNVMVPLTPAEEVLGVSLPHRRMEDWKWTDLRRMISGVYPATDVAVKADDVARLVKSSPFHGVTAHRIVFVNGVLDEAHSQLQGLVLSRTLPTLPHTETVVAMNAALKAQGVHLTLSGTADTPVEIMCVATNGIARSIAVRNHIEVQAGSSATIIETHVGEGDYLANAVTSISIGEGARLDRIKVELESPRARHLSHVTTVLAKNAIFRDVTLTSGSVLNRQNGTVTFTGEGGDAKLSGAYLLRGRQHADTKLVIDHAVPHCTSRELFKCVMDGNARGIFQGKAIVRPHAQKTDGKQSSHALLLSETAEFDAKPELEIYADDVVCGHGATCGEINHDHMFYLKSRGIPEAEAKSLLVAAFVGEAFDDVVREDVREALVAFAERWLVS